MAFVLRRDGSQDSVEAFRESWRRYREYLAAIADKLPSAAREFALADWHYDFRDQRAPHDAWIESILVFETSSGERQQNRQVHIKIRLLGAYHDGRIEIEYVNVVRYSLGSEYPEHGSWEYDEIRLSEDGFVIHEIEIGGRTWRIECEDIRHIWRPDRPGT